MSLHSSNGFEINRSTFNSAQTQVNINITVNTISHSRRRTSRDEDNSHNRRVRARIHQSQSDDFRRRRGSSHGSRGYGGPVSPRGNRNHDRRGGSRDKGGNRRRKNGGGRSSTTAAPNDNLPPTSASTPNDGSTPPSLPPGPSFSGSNVDGESRDEAHGSRQERSPLSFWPSNRVGNVNTRQSDLENRLSAHEAEIDRLHHLNETLMLNTMTTPHGRVQSRT
ncbi:hypothetical protein Moror_1120 [Moniliophthora roreri MCA 2997]|uniref:Uncharacterized protein n=1 Tax=Moniliophthora roreri (strain MCA 2997) TaxID=1381753 RepID=V2XIY2_MONRO|nr:hypothetical protein Moror_1120 [Moniliophthora roreri MCA 2997]